MSYAIQFSVIILRLGRLIQSQLVNSDSGFGLSESKYIGVHLCGIWALTFFFVCLYYSKCAKIYCIKNKSETASCFFDYINLVENQFNKKVKKKNTMW